jgi:hypothetical protein
MNFMQLIQSLDDLLYELMSWLIFFPLTLWRTVTRPLKMMAYARKELSVAPEKQFSEALSPPLFLLLALLVSHAIELALNGGTNAIVADNHGLARFVDNDTKLLILRLAVFSTIPLLIATIATVANKATLSDETLKLPFYEQCYPAAPFALALGIGTLLLHRGPALTVLGLLIVLVSLAAYLAVQVVWFRRQLGCGILRASLLVTSAMVGGVLFTFTIGRLFI